MIKIESHFGANVCLIFMLAVLLKLFKNIFLNSFPKRLTQYIYNGNALLDCTNILR